MLVIDLHTLVLVVTRVVSKTSLSTGVLLSFRCGVLNLKGYGSAYIGELFTLHNSGSSGLVVNILRDEALNLLIGALALEPYSRLSEGTKVVGSRTLATLTLGYSAIGCLLDPLGGLIVSTHRIDSKHRWLVESSSPGIISRMSVFEPLETGVISIDVLVPIGLGQRELIVGDRQVGKTALGIDTIINQKHNNMLCVFAVIGRRASSALEMFLSLVRRQAYFYVSMVIASASAASVCQFLCAYTATSLSEFFMLVYETPSFLMLDDLSSHAVAYRELSLLLRRPPGREAFPGEIFFVHSRLLERSAKLTTSIGGGSCTSLPVVETLAGDVSSYITTNVISITDGQLFLAMDLFHSGLKPAIDVGLSVTRVGSAAQWSGIKMVAGSYKLDLSQLAELQSFSQFSSELGAETLYKLRKGTRLLELLKQQSGSPISLSNQLFTITAAKRDLFCQLDISSIKDVLCLYYTLPLWCGLLN